ncbi:MAG: type II toxin-antitoxin system RelE/ParE family toxin [Oculatellaceae cyanobacterium Prado106]|jgi:plasmid stabilization system protein ParE|nr:type II toxin-antitoxin system RelE/ParE family toxin [Oculatellaceae cyanobacterium Prado106]
MPIILRTTQANRDLLQIWITVAERRSDEAADRLLDEIADLCDLLAQRPQMGRTREEFSIPLRSFPIQSTSYVIFYNPIPGGIQIYRVLDGRMDLNQLL